MEKGSNEAMYVLSLVVLMVSAGHNSLRLLRTHAHTHTHTHTPRTPKAIFLNLSLCLCVRRTLHLGQCREDIWMCGTQ